VDNPYRPLPSVPAPKRSVVAEAEPPPSRAIRVRQWNDGSTRLRLGSAVSPWLRVGYWVMAVALGSGGAVSMCTDCGSVHNFAVPLLALYCLWRGLRALAAEEIFVTPAAVLLRRRFARAQVRLRSEVSTVVVGGGSAGAQLELQVGRERLPLADGLGYDDAQLRWIARRLRRALEAAG
jgi:hypothetical protein